MNKNEITGRVITTNSTKSNVLTKPFHEVMYSGDVCIYCSNVKRLKIYPDYCKVYSGSLGYCKASV